MFRCNTCSYSSAKKFNLQKHVKNMHSRDASGTELQRTELPSNNTEIVLENTDNNAQITTRNIEITANIDQRNLVCEKCQKHFKTARGFKNHHPICKGVSNILECHFCHKIYSCQQSKSKHIKLCKIRKAQEQAQAQTASLPLTDSNNTNTQQIIYNIYNNNYYICSDAV